MYRRIFVLFSVLGLELFLLFYGILFFAHQIPLVRVGLCLVSYGVVLSLLRGAEEPAYKISWLLLLLPFPLLGGCVFLLLKGQGFDKAGKIAGHQMKHRLIQGLSCDYIEEKLPLLPGFSQGKLQVHYLEQYGGCPGFQGTCARYFSSGEQLLPRLLQELGRAKSYIFLEFFLIAPGVFWDEILGILRQKVREGVLVRLIYDDAGCFFTLGKGFLREMSAYGIETKVFHPIYPVWTTQLNHRDHRKILVIDGVVSVTGGMNLGDEYINAKPRFGYWKDSAILLKGPGVWAMTLMFLSMWEYCGGEKESFSKFFPPNMPFFQETSVVLPYTDIPTEKEALGRQVFLNLILRAKKWIHITTPYLVLDTCTQNALCQVAKTGVRVVIVTPHIPDKKWVFQVTRANYPLLQTAGVEIYEFTPGFIHGKNVIVDGVFASTGTINLDFRSLFLHFENAVWLWHSPCIAQMEQDFQETLARSQKMPLEKHNKITGLFRSVLQIFSPFM